jgi:hypothetical protein
MLRRILVGLAAVAVLMVTFTPADAQRRGGGARAGVARGGAVGVRGGRGGAVAVRGARGGAVAVRGGRYGYRYGVGAAAVGAAAVGAAAAGAYYGGAGCGYDPYGNYICPGRYNPY